MSAPTPPAIWTLYTEDVHGSQAVSVHADEQAALDCVFTVFDEDDEFGDDLMALRNATDLYVNIESHPLPESITDFWTALPDVQESYTLAMRSAGVPADIIAQITATVTDAVANNLGDN